MKKSTAKKISAAIGTSLLPVVYSIAIPIRIVKDTVVMVKDCIEGAKEGYEAMSYIIDRCDEVAEEMYGKPLYENDNEETISFEEAKEAYFELRKETGV